jgi:hypothetical protein
VLTEKKERTKMNKTKNRITAIAIAIFLMLSMSASMTLIPNASAHTPAWNIPTYAYVWASPNPVGVNQTVSIYMWLTNYYYGSEEGNGYDFHNYELTITAPNGAVTTQTFAVITDPTSNQHTDFVPSQVGKYTLNFTYPGQVYNNGPALYSVAMFAPPEPNPYFNDTFLPSSASTTFTVQTTPLPAPLSGAPLPTAYWTRPIYGENTGWYTIASNWLGVGAPGYAGWDGAASGLGMFPGDAVGSQTSHVMWTKPLQSGGVVGGNDVAIPGDTFFDGSAYLTRYNNPIILDGMLYYTEPIGFTNTGYAMFGPAPAGTGYGPTVCVNLQTGQQIWSSANVPALSMGYIQSIDTVNEHGVTPPILIAIEGSTWMGYDGDTGNALFSVTNVPTGVEAMGPDGNYLIYVLANFGTATEPDWNLAEWDSSLVFMPLGAGAPTYTGTFNGGSGSDYDWNVSVPWLNTENPNTMTSPLSTIAANYNDGILCEHGAYPSNGENLVYPTVSQTPYTFFFINLNATKGEIGQVLWSNTLQPPANNLTVVPPGIPDWNSRVFIECYKETIQWVGYSLDTGKQIWGPLAPQQALDYYGTPGPGTLAGQLADGKLYSSAYGGTVYCYNDLTGKLLWTYGNGGAGNSTNAGFNYPYGDYPTFVNAIGNGIVYLVTTAHTWTTPIYKGAMATAINATTGQQIWQISGITAEFSGVSYAMADGYNTWFNGYDNSIYVVGRGSSATTVQAPQTAITEGNKVIIQGTVMDISAGTTQTEQAADFPHGVPCASDASMTAWMGYVYQQQPEPTNFTGVTVTLTAIDPNNNFITLGTATTDATGHFIYAWQTPQVPGKYTVTATFAGTNGYWGSSDETGMFVQSPAATPAPTASPPTGLASTSTVELGIVAVIIVIIIIGVVLALLMMRKHP